MLVLQVFIEQARVDRLKYDSIIDALYMDKGDKKVKNNWCMDSQLGNS